MNALIVSKIGHGQGSRTADVSFDQDNVVIIVVETDYTEFYHLKIKSTKQNEQSKKKTKNKYLASEQS